MPDSAGIYDFPDKLLAAHKQWQQALRVAYEAATNQLVELTSPLNGSHYLIELRKTADQRPILVLEPHNDDLVLSAGGYLLTSPRPLTVVTVFTRSRSVHPAVTHLSTVDEISRLRAAESAEAFRAFQATQHLLGFKDAGPPYVAFDPTRVDRIIEELRPVFQANLGAELLAPAGVTRHPDHLLVHEVACRLGCRWFWDDTSFYPTYAANVDDQRLFELRTEGRLAVYAEDITSSTLDKLTLLLMYQSQMQPIREMYRVLRYNWTVATTTLSQDANHNLDRFAERFFRLREEEG